MKEPYQQRQTVILSYTAGEINLGKAAELIGVSQEEMKEILAENDVEIYLGPTTVEGLLQDAANA